MEFKAGWWHAEDETCLVKFRDEWVKTSGPREPENHFLPKSKRNTVTLKNFKISKYRMKIKSLHLELDRRVITSCSFIAVKMIHEIEWLLREKGILYLYLEICHLKKPQTFYEKGHANNSNIQDMPWLPGFDVHFSKKKVDEAYKRILVAGNSQIYSMRHRIKETYQKIINFLSMSTEKQVLWSKNSVFQRSQTNTQEKYHNFRTLENLD